MTKKIVSLFTLIAFCLFSFSCMTTTSEVRKVPMVAATAEGTMDVYGIQTKEGKYIEFSDNDPGYLSQNVIKGYRKDSNLIGKDQIREIIEHEDPIYIIKTHDGKQYKGHLTDESKYECQEYISVPLSDVDLVWIKKYFEVEEVDSRSTIIVTLVVAALVVSAALSQSPRRSSSGSSCPFIYAFDGDNYVFNAEPYGGAFTQGLQRTDWCGLENLNEVDGMYSILVSNELEETQYTDELKLVVVDHPKEVKVAPDLSGGIHTVFDSITPLFAYDGNGKDILPYVEKNDKVFWVSQDKDTSPQNSGSIKEELIFEFPKPKGASKAKLVVNASTTMWGSEAGKIYLDLYGEKIGDWYEDIDNYGPALSLLTKMNIREELFGLHIRVATDNGWKTKGVIFGGGPLASEDKIYSIDVSDVTGDNLRIKLTPPTAFWMINFMAVDYSDDLPISVTEVVAIEAVGHTGQDVSWLLSRTDNQYLVMPNIGDYAKLVFISPPQIPNMDRTHFLKASGYYNMHLQGDGVPQYDLLNRIHTEPGFAVKFAYEEYFKRKKERTEKIK